MGAIGHSDFYPNGGSIQSGCLSDLTGSCSHSRSWQFFAESINSNVGFYGKPCTSFLSYVFGRCENKPILKMGGSKIDQAGAGDYYLSTSAVAPFAKGRWISRVVLDILNFYCLESIQRTNELCTVNCSTYSFSSLRKPAKLEVPKSTVRRFGKLFLFFFFLRLTIPTNRYFSDIFLFVTSISNKENPFEWKLLSATKAQQRFNSIII